MNFKLLPEKIFQDMVSNFTSAIDKGYPDIVSPLTYYAYVNEKSILGYSSFRDMEKFYFVGNTYVMPDSRGKGVYTSLLTNRNNHLSDKPKVTLVNPIEGTDISQLLYQVAKQGGVIVNSYEEVADIMTEDIYTSLSKLPMYVYR